MQLVTRVHPVLLAAVFFLLAGSGWGEEPGFDDRGAGPLAPTSSPVLELANRTIWLSPRLPLSASAWGAAESLAAALSAHSAGVEWGIERETVLSRGGRVVYSFVQERDGVRVESALGRALVRERVDGRFEIAYAAVRGAVRELPPRAIEIDAASAVERVRVRDDARGLTSWELPELRYVSTPAAVRLAWCFRGASAPTRSRVRSYAVDVESGRVLRSRSEIYHAEIDGQLLGNATPELEPPVNGAATESVVIPEARVEAGGIEAFANAAGEYLILDLDPISTTVRGYLEGPWATVVNESGAADVPELTVTPDATADLTFNASDAVTSEAQVNAYVHTHRTHDFYTSRLPDFEELDLSLECNVNIENSCNAFFTVFQGQPSINFFQAGTNGTSVCVNTAYSTVVAHEYGHFIVDRLGLAQGAFGEGFADCVSMLQYDDPIIGKDFFGIDQPVRDVPAANQQYPCAGTVHTCGQVLGGVVWDLRLALEDDPALTDALEVAQQLFVDWSALTLGGDGDNSAHPATAIEFLTVADDDGDINNGTPYYQEICLAFASHGIDCPELAGIGIAFPAGRPANLTPDVPTVIEFHVEPIDATPAAGSARLYVSVAGAAFEEITPDEVVANEYLAVIDAAECADDVRYYFAAEDTNGNRTFSPQSAPRESYQATVALAIEDAVLEDFELDRGWTVGDPDDPDDATSGVWVRDDPVGTADAAGPIQPEFDHSPDPADTCYFTGQAAFGLSVGTEDIDNGKTTLVSPNYDLSGGGVYFVSYHRWFSNGSGLNPNTDTFRVEVSNLGGAAGTWLSVETIGPDGPDTAGGWMFHRFRLDDIVEPTSTTRFRFIAEDENDPVTGQGSLVEAALDDFRIEFYSCGDPTGFLRGDCDGRGGVDITDAIELFRFLFLGQSPPVCEDACDANDNGAVSLVDAFTILDALFSTETIPAPFPLCGDDPTDDALDCETPCL